MDGKSFGTPFAVLVGVIEVGVPPVYFLRVMVSGELKAGAVTPPIVNSTIPASSWSVVASAKR